ncbi:MAG: class A beta-lactamase-related serine hydrolase [Rhodobacteraceae bacterium]|nr:class A beta-lactamase-related serine hydrolase [Paracoccaceae bacterium]MCF8513846.1 class A beta-lactamase-related serine hydrolase [Paracoccaceae bacterium]MCF8518090.1 class A beta-lactamase-related serine hydrolase [Paracoccaceae bacterium]
MPCSDGSKVVAAGVIAWSLGASSPSFAAECVIPDNTDWTVNVSCEITATRIASRNVRVAESATLTVESSGSLIIDTRSFALRVDPQARVRIRPGGQIRSNQVGPLLQRQTDGGSFGYYLKAVNGPVIEAYNPNLSFHPSSSIKLLYMIEALRQVDQGTLNLNTTNLNTCPAVIAAGPPATTTSCPVNFVSTSATSTGSGGNGNNCTVPPVANTVASCSGALVNLPLGTGLCAMMKVSNNVSANAIQETVGAGNPVAGWSTMLSDAGTAAGLTSTSFANRMGCGGPTFGPTSNQTTLVDMGRLLEEMVSDPAILFPSTLPANVSFATTAAYLFMNNDRNNGNGLGPNLQTIINEQATELGLPAGVNTNFFSGTAGPGGAGTIGGVRFVHKRGSNASKDMDGDGIIDPDLNGDGVADITDPRDYRTMIGWISLPINGGAGSREYVFGLFYNDIDPTSSQDDLRLVLPQMLRPVIRSALQSF